MNPPHIASEAVLLIACITMWSLSQSYPATSARSKVERDLAADADAGFLNACVIGNGYVKDDRSGNERGLENFGPPAAPLVNRPLKSAIVFTLALFCSVSFGFAAALPDPLWQKALAVARTNAEWVAGLVVTRSEVVYKGETNGVQEIWKRSRLGTNAEVITDTVKVLEDGKDVTEREKKEEKGRKKEKASGAASGNPFNADVQDRLFLAVTNRARNIAGKDCVGYVFEVRNTNGPKTRGVAWLEKDTGIPTELENVTLDTLPDKHLTGMNITTCYESTADGAWRVKEMRTFCKVSRFFIKADVQSITRFSDYWKRPRRKAGAER